ncbi:hypothetical protein ACFV85_14900 [Streptomyces niveus]|uniref:hypothetical protein n=1 Tax=Streptomyces niveus TaxID=193462 RepID=UPI003663B519
MDEQIIVDTAAAHAATGVAPGTLRVWLYRRHLTHHGRDTAGRDLVDLAEVQARVVAKAA